MNIFDEVLAANAAFAEAEPHNDRPAPPARQLAVLTCMDARILPLTVFGLENGDAHVLRNAGGRVTDDALRSLLVSTHLLGVRNIAVVHHTECGMANNSNEVIRTCVQEATGKDDIPIEFHAIEGDPDEAIRGDVAKLLEAALLPEGTVVHGFQYDVRTGKLRQVV